MNDALFEQLLYEEESTTLDFKKEQYRFAKATDDEQSELLKDILGLANAWRRSEAYIIIGVEEVRGGRGIVVGIPRADHLDDHSLQQFVNIKTNRPVLFHYEAFGYQGKQVGIIRIDEQPRPVYLKRDFGKLKKEQVYVRRGSSTDPTKPADPDEIARMGARPEPQAAELAVAFGAIDRDDSRGTTIVWEAECCDMPPSEAIPDYTEGTRRYTAFGLDLTLPEIGPSMTHMNRDYYRDRAQYEFLTRLLRPVRVMISNGRVPAGSVRVELTLPARAGIMALYPSQLPEAPWRVQKWFPSPTALNSIRPALRRSPGEVTIEENEQRIRIEVDCGDLQPGRTVWSDVFWIGIGSSRDASLPGRIYADNLPAPHEFTLTISATVKETSMTVEELIALPHAAGE